jgi:hypothetical protein
MMEFLFPAALVTGIGGVLIYAAQNARKRFAALTAVLADDAQVRLTPGVSWRSTTQIETRAPLRQATMVSVAGDKNEPARWSITTQVDALVAKTTVSLSREGFAGKLRERIGLKDVHIGIDDFDALVCLRGSDADLLRGVFTTPAVMRATLELFADQSFMRLDVGTSGRVTCEMRRAGLDGLDMKRKLLAVVALADALADGAYARPLPDPASAVRTAGVGGASGAPVSVPLGDRRT